MGEIPIWIILISLKRFISQFIRQLDLFDHLLHTFKVEPIRIFVWEWLNVGTVPTFKKHNVGTVPTFKKHNIGTVPTFKRHNIGTVPTHKMHNVGTPKFYDFF